MAIPVIDKLESTRTRFHPIAPIFKDESTTANNIFIIEDIFKRQLKLDEENPDFSNNIRLVYGDLKTWSRIQSAKTLRGEISQLPFDRFQWLVPGLGLWHLRLNMLQLLHKIHWGEGSAADPSTLQYAADRWNRSRVVQPNDFQALEDLIVHSYQARIVGRWVALLRRQNVDTNRIENVKPWLEANASTWDKIVGHISDHFRAPPLSSKLSTQAPVRDQQFQNHQHFCAHVEIYLTLKHAIKYADIGLLRHALRAVTVIFQAEIAGTPKYAQALLYTLHLVDSPAAAIELQECVLANSLVNLRGNADTNFELDRLLELLNNNLKAFQYDRSYYSKHSDILLENWALNGPYFTELRRTMELAFGKANSAAHPPKSAAEDIWSMASALAYRSLSPVTEKDRFSLSPTVNLFYAGLERLSGNVTKYNERNVKGVSGSEELENEMNAPAELNINIPPGPGSPILHDTPSADEADV